MKKFKVKFSWFASMRGYDAVEVEANTEAEARELYKDDVYLDYNSNCKLIDMDTEIYDVAEVP